MPIVYINNAATAWPKAPHVADIVAEQINTQLVHAGRTGFDTPDSEADCRKLLAQQMGVDDANRIILTANATHAINIALHGFRLQPGATVLTTMAEHNAVLRPLHYLKTHKNVRVIYTDIDISGRVMIEKWAESLEKYRPQLAVFYSCIQCYWQYQPS